MQRNDQVGQQKSNPCHIPNNADRAELLTKESIQTKLRQYIQSLNHIDGLSAVPPEKIKDLIDRALIQNKSEIDSAMLGAADINVADDRFLLARINTRYKLCHKIFSTYFNFYNILKEFKDTEQVFAKQMQEVAEVMKRNGGPLSANINKSLKAERAAREKSHSFIKSFLGSNAKNKLTATDEGRLSYLEENDWQLDYTKYFAFNTAFDRLAKPKMSLTQDAEQYHFIKLFSDFINDFDVMKLPIFLQELRNTFRTAEVLEFLNSFMEVIIFYYVYAKSGIDGTNVSLEDQRVLSDHLIKPIQRLPRWQLLFRELEAHLKTLGLEEKAHNEAQAHLIEIKQKMGRILEYANDNVSHTLRNDNPVVLAQLCATIINPDDFPPREATPASLGLRTLSLLAEPKPFIQQDASGELSRSPSLQSRND